MFLNFEAAAPKPQKYVIYDHVLYFYYYYLLCSLH